VNHPEYRTMASRPGARRELSFLYLGSHGEIGHGSIDLAAPAPDQRHGIELLDVKTTQCEAAVAADRAEQYAPQRDVYVTAAGAITGLPVERFAFQFSRAGVQISSPVTPAGAAAASERFAATVESIGEGAAPLTQFPHECRFCGYRRVRLCAGVPFTERTLDQIFERLSRDRFRTRFRLGEDEREYLRSRGLTQVMEHARKIIVERLAPASPRNDGRQTPWRGHPVFVAQHATACCCRTCLEEWHGISRGHALQPAEIEHVLAAIQRWLQNETDTQTPPSVTAKSATQLELL
jgi:hypothetical protein